MEAFAKSVEFFILVCEKSKMLVQSPRYECICADIDGYDSASRGASKLGLRRWLLSEGDAYTNLPWWAIIRKRLFSDADPAGSLTDEQSRGATASLKGLLEDYLGVLVHYGLDGAFHKYAMWLSRQDEDVATEMRRHFEQSR